MNTDNLGKFLKAGILVVVVLALVMSGTSSFITEKQTNQVSSEYEVSIEQAKEMIRTQNAILVDVQEGENSVQKITGAVAVTVVDIGCGSCLERKLQQYDSIIIYSENDKLRTTSSEYLRSNQYTVYELIEDPQPDDFSTIDITYEDIIFPEDKYISVELSDSDARVNAFERGGRIKRLYGESFSFGSNPRESADLFIQNNAHLFGVDVEDVVYQYTQPIMYDADTEEYKFFGINYAQVNDGISVFRSRLILLVRNEEGYPLVLASADLRDLNEYGSKTQLQQLQVEQGIANAKEANPNLVHFEPEELVIWAGVDDTYVDPAIAYSFIGDNEYSQGDINPEKELFVVHAETGEILYQENMILNTDVTGNVQGRATQGIKADICDDEVGFPMRYARVNIGGTIAYTDSNGDFIIPNGGTSPVTVESRLRGQWFRVFNQATGGDAVLYEYNVIPPGPVNFMQNQPNTDEYLRAQVNGYLQSNIVRDFTLTYNPAYPGLQQSEFPVNVNLQDTCNAFYDYSSINFFRSGGGCANSAFSTIIHHEYGHHLVAMAGSGQDAYGEGMGDVMGVLITDVAELAWGFYNDCNDYMRTADNNIQYPCSGAIHYCGQLLSGCVWETRNELLITNPGTYIDIISNLAVNAMLVHTGSSIDPSITIDYLVLDDDNGNIYDGTPHYIEIATGFGEHNMDAPPLALLAFTFPDGLPEIISPSGGTALRAEVNGVAGEPEPGTGILYYNDGSGWQQQAMTEIEPNVYDAIFPEVECLTEVSYYFSAETTTQQTQYWPIDAPDDFYTTVAAYSFEVEFEDNFETNQGWVVENSAGLTDGQWGRGIPIGGGVRGDPPTDYDGSGNCYLTDNTEGNSDVDDGLTWLISPTLDLSGDDESQIHYALWYTNNFGADPNNDWFKTYVSNDNGANWVLAESIGPQTPIPEDWNVHSFLVSDYVALNDQIKVRFEASDLYDGSVVEAGIDDFWVHSYTCSIPISPDESFITLTDEITTGMTTCPLGDGPLYQYAMVTVENQQGVPIEGITAEEIEFFVSDAGASWFGTLSCTFTAVDLQTNANGEIRFEIQGDTSILGDISITATVLGIPLNDIDYLSCISMDYEPDGDVDLADFIQFGNDWGTTNPESDFDWSGGIIELNDFITFGSHWGH